MGSFSRRAFLPLLVGLVSVSAAGAGPPVILCPGVARAPGVNGTVWRSSAVLENPTAASQSVLLELLPRGGSAVAVSRTIALAPGETREIPNLYDFLSAPDGAGMLRVTGSVITWVRTYNQGTGGTFGQDVPGVAPGAGYAPREAVVFPYSTPADVATGFRSNLLLADLDATDITVTFRAGGATASMTVPAGAFVQINNFGAFLGSPAGFSAVTLSADGRWFGVVSTIDPDTGDPTTVRGLSPGDTGTHLYAGVASAPGVNNATWRSEAVLSNPGSAPVQALLELIPRGQGQVSSSATVALDPEATTRIPDLYQFLGAPSGAGELRVSGGVLAWLRTYNQQGSQTFGQDLLPVPPAGGFAPLERVVFPYHATADVTADFRSNFLLLNLETRDIVVSLRSGSITKTQTVPAGSFVQINNLGAFLGAAAGAGSVWVTADGRWTGSVATIDPSTNDPTTFRAVRGWEPPSSADLIDAALAAGAIGSEQALTYKLFADFSDPRLPPQFRGDDRDVLEMPSVDEAISRWTSLSPATQAVVGPFLTPAFYVGSWWDLLNPAGVRTDPASGRGPKAGGLPCDSWVDSGCPARIKDWSHIDTQHLRIWFQTALAGTDGVIAGDLASEGENTIWPELLRVMGVQPILGTDFSTDTAPRLDVILNRGLAGGTDGRTTPTKQWLNPGWNCQPSLTFIILNADGPNLRQALAHEMMHAAQHAIDLSKQGCAAFNWLGDATATWFEDDVYPGDQDEHRFAPIYLNSPELSLEDISVPNRAYAGYLFFFYLTRVRSPALPASSVGDAWEAVAGTDPISAVGSALQKNGTKFDTAWPEFALYNWNFADPYNAYQTVDALNDEADNRKAVSATLPDGDDTDNLEDVADLKMPHLSSRYYVYTFDDDTVSTIVFYNGMKDAVDVTSLSTSLGSAYTAPAPADPSSTQGAHVDALLKIDGTWTHEDWTNKPYRSFCRDATRERLQALVIVLTNADASNDLSPPGPKPPLIWASNIGCYGWNVTANLAAHYPGQAIDDTMTVTDLRFEAFGDLAADPNTLEYRVFHATSGAYSWKLSGTTSAGCTVSGSVNEPAAADPGDFYETLPYVTDGPGHRGMLTTILQKWIKAMGYFPATISGCPDQSGSGNTSWPISYYVLSVLQSEEGVKFSADGKSLDVDVSQLPGAGQAGLLTGSWHFVSKPQ